MSNRRWLEQALTEKYIPLLRSLEDTEQGQQVAAMLCRELRDGWTHRGMVSLRQQQSLMDQVRRRIRRDLGEHFSLKQINFSTQEWIDLNLEKQKAVATRNESVQFLENPDGIVAAAVRLLESPEWADVAAGLAVLTGRRSSELLSTANFIKKSHWSLEFSGALKRRGERQTLTFEIPTLTTADRVIAALDKVRRELPEATRLDATTVNQKYGRAVEQACDRAFAGLVPTRNGKTSLYTHLFRAVYATIATFWYCPPSVNSEEFKAAIQGHFAVLDEKNPELRRSLAAGRHYSDYEIADAVIAQYKGKRKGIKLGWGGIRPIEMFAAAYKDSQIPADTVPPADPPEASMADKPEDKPEDNIVRVRIYEPDRVRLYQILRRLGLEGSHPDQMRALVDYLEENTAAIRQPTAPAQPPEWETRLEQMEAQIESIVATLQSLQPMAATALPAPSAPSSGTAQLPPDASAEALTAPPPRTGRKRGKSDGIIHAAIDAIMAYNDEPGRRHDEKWFISINGLKAYTKSQKAINRILDARQAEIHAHHQRHQLDEKHNYRHRGESITDFVPLPELDEAA